MDYTQLKLSLSEQIWDRYVEVTTCIFYSSVYCEERREKQYGVYFWVVYICFAVPPILASLQKLGILNTPSQIIAISLICLLVPIILRYKDKYLVYALFGFLNQNIQSLLILNKRLEQYRDCLRILYFHSVAINANEQETKDIEMKFQNLSLQYQDDMYKHDDLTGRIDERIQTIAQKKTKEYIETMSAYEKEY